MISSNSNSSIRDLDQIRESNQVDVSSRWVTIGLFILSGACLLFIALAFGYRFKNTSSTKKVDPLGELASRSSSTALRSNEITFPSLLSDKSAPAAPLVATYTNALPSTNMVKGVESPNTFSSFGPSQLPLALIPTHHASANSLVRTQDPLSALVEVDSSSNNLNKSAPGHDGGWQVQVASSPKLEDAENLATRLREKGRPAYTQKANVPKRGTWYRVRIGPFSTRNEAIRYRNKIESDLHMPSFVIESEQHAKRKP